MNRNTFRLLAAALAVAGASGCGGKIDGIPSSNGLSSSVSELEQGATVQRAYLGVDDHVTVGPVRVVTPFALVGGAQVELEVVTPDSSPVRFELWQAHVDGSTTLVMPVDAPSGFALEDIEATEDGTWVLTFPVLPPGQVIVHMDCVGGQHGCAVARQPGETCPAGWSCDEGLACELPVGVCGPLAGVGTCVLPPPSCAADSTPVCGCDGSTYPSACSARLAGTPILTSGACGG
jgi:Kazal-type serine protease inhibitor domain